jgi:hypothetical protein
LQQLTIGSGFAVMPEVDEPAPGQMNAIALLSIVRTDPFTLPLLTPLPRFIYEISI